VRTLLSRAFSADRMAPQRARSALTEISLSDLDGDALLLIVSELVANSVKHAGLGPSEEIGLLILETQHGIRLEVKDLGDGERAISRALSDARSPALAADGQTGRFGLRLIVDLADRTGVRWEDGTIVWCELDRDSAAAR
jgi:anti-sigma regulatory factor (Ser/Thr protein kinase)